MTQTRAIQAAADVICRAMKQGKSVPTSLAFALDAAGMLQSPEAAAEVARLRARLAVLEAGVPVMQSALLRALDRVAELESERHTTNAALAEVTLALRARVGDGATRTVDEDPIAYALTEKAEEIASAIEARGAAFLPGHPVWPYVPVFAGIARGQDVPPRSRPCGRELSTGEPCPDHPQPASAASGKDVSPQVHRLRDLLARQRRDQEDPHDGPLHHDYATGRDLPEVRS